MTEPLTLKRQPPRIRALQPALEVRNVGKVFHSDRSYSTVLDNVTFKVGTGELLCLLGPSGCGKSTLLKLLAGFIKPSSGRILINGDNVQQPGADRCVVFQEDALFPWLTVAENVAFGAKGTVPARRLDIDVHRHLEMVGLAAHKDYLPRDISGGMKQRVALARVMILKPKVLLMDEPFGALDAQNREEMQNLLLNLWSELSHTIIFVTHDLVEAITLADRILMMGRDAGPIQTEIAVGLPRPRRKESYEFHLFYRDLRNRFKPAQGIL